MLKYKLVRLAPNMTGGADTSNGLKCRNNFTKDLKEDEKEKDAIKDIYNKPYCKDNKYTYQCTETMISKIPPSHVKYKCMIDKTPQDWDNTTNCVGATPEDINKKQFGYNCTLTNNTNYKPNGLAIFDVDDVLLYTRYEPHNSDTSKFLCNLFFILIDVLKKLNIDIAIASNGGSFATIIDKIKKIKTNDTKKYINYLYNPYNIIFKGVIKKDIRRFYIKWDDQNEDSKYPEIYKIVQLYNNKNNIIFFDDDNSKDVSKQLKDNDDIDMTFFHVKEGESPIKSLKNSLDLKKYEGMQDIDYTSQTMYILNYYIDSRKFIQHNSTDDELINKLNQKLVFLKVSNFYAKINNKTGMITNDLNQLELEKALEDDITFCKKYPKTAELIIETYFREQFSITPPSQQF